ncbi:unnamed protein product [Heligmosomoides polygyrus]|uniref:Reverse transcriptase domain-containing protein n=1 Tax=Heligmosomoides polygyrus TaxID=6339 RepID=A0A183GIR2_HELPZ|nr:unnamed protein product [Heligmosomoides polygyrus]
MPERSTTDAIFIARQVLEKYREKREPCYRAFLGLEKVYNRLPRTVLCKAIRGRGVWASQITDTIKATYEGTEAPIRTPHAATRM